jgi:hypothetical protein
MLSQNVSLLSKKSIFFKRHIAASILSLGFIVTNCGSSALALPRFKEPSRFNSSGQTNFSFPLTAGTSVLIHNQASRICLLDGPEDLLTNQAYARAVKDIVRFNYTAEELVPGTTTLLSKAGVNITCSHPAVKAIRATCPKCSCSPNSVVGQSAEGLELMQAWLNRVAPRRKTLNNVIALDIPSSQGYNLFSSRMQSSIVASGQNGLFHVIPFAGPTGNVAGQARVADLVRALHAVAVANENNPAKPLALLGEWVINPASRAVSCQLMRLSRGVGIYVPRTSGAIPTNPGPEPTSTPTLQPTQTAVATTTSVPTNVPTFPATNTPLPTSTVTPKPTNTATPMPTATSSPLPSSTPTPLPTSTARPPSTPTPFPPTPTATPNPDQCPFDSETVAGPCGCGYLGVLDVDNNGAPDCKLPQLARPAAIPRNSIAILNISTRPSERIFRMKMDRGVVTTTWATQRPYVQVNALKLVNGQLVGAGWSIGSQLVEGREFSFDLRPGIYAVRAAHTATVFMSGPTSYNNWSSFSDATIVTIE